MSDPILVYVAGPYSAPDRAGVEQNIEAAVALGIEVAKLGAMPVIPHANTAHPDFEKIQPYQFWVAGTMALLRGCGAIIMRKGWEASSGSRGEHQEMFSLGRPVFYSIEELRVWLEARAILGFDEDSGDPHGVDHCQCGHLRRYHVGCSEHDACCDEDGCECRAFAFTTDDEANEGAR